MATHILIERDTRAETYHAMREVYAESHENGAATLRGVLHASLQGGEGLNSDSDALAESLFVQTPKESDYFERREAARSAYLRGASHWRGVVREVLSSFAYTEEHFNERAMSEEELPSGALAAVATMLAYGWWWQMGHFNVLIEQWERRSWFIQPVEQWAQSGLELAFDNFEARVMERARS